MSKYAPHPRGTNSARANSTTICQKCLGTGHFIYECKSTRPYVSRPSRTEQLEKPSVLEKLKKQGNPSVDIPEEFKSKTGAANKILEAKEKERAQKQRPTKRRRSASSSSNSGSSSGSESSDSDSGSSDSESSRSRSRSRERNRKRKTPRRRTPSTDSQGE